MKDTEALLLAIPGVTEAEVFAKLLVRCEFPMTDETIIALQEAQDWIEHETGWKVEMTISMGKRPEPVPPTDNELQAEFAMWERVSDQTLVNFEGKLEEGDDSGRVFVVTGRIVGQKAFVDNPSILKSVRHFIPKPKEDNDVVHAEDM